MTKINNKTFSGDSPTKSNIDLRSKEFEDDVKHNFKEFDKWLNEKADKDGIASYVFILYRDTNRTNNHTAQISIRSCVPDDIIDVIYQIARHLFEEIATHEAHKLYVLNKLKALVMNLEKMVLKDIGVKDFFKD